MSRQRLVGGAPRASSWTPGVRVEGPERYQTGRGCLGLALLLLACAAIAVVAIQLFGESWSR